MHNGIHVCENSKWNRYTEVGFRKKRCIKFLNSEEMVKLQDIDQIFKNRLHERNCLIIVNNCQHHMHLCLFEASGKIRKEMENLVIHFQNDSLPLYAV